MLPGRIPPVRSFDSATFSFALGVMGLSPACTWVFVALTLCLTPTGSLSMQCTERALRSTVTELRYKPGIHATISCLSHPDVKIWIRNGKVYNQGEITCKLDGDRILLEAAVRPMGCSLEEDVNSTLITVECVSLDTDDVSTTLSAHVRSSYKEGRITTSPAVILNGNSTSEQLKGGDHMPTWMRIVRYLSLLGLPALLFALFCVWYKEIFRMCDTETVRGRHEDLQDAEAVITPPAGNDRDPDVHMRLRSLSPHSMVSTDEPEAWASCTN